MAAKPAAAPMSVSPLSQESILGGSATLPLTHPAWGESVWKEKEPGAEENSFPDPAITANSFSSATASWRALVGPRLHSRWEHRSTAGLPTLGADDQGRGWAGVNRCSFHVTQGQQIPLTF